MSKLDKIGYHDKETGELLDENIVDSIKKEDYSKTIKLVESKYKNDPMSLNLDEIELLMRIKKVSKSIKLNYKKEGYFSIKNDSNYKDFNYRTLAVLFLVSQNLSSEGRITYANNHAVKSFQDLKLFLDLSDSDWNKHINKDIKKYNLIKKERIGNDVFLIVNPFYVFKDRKISETAFIAFHKDLKQKLTGIEYLYLIKTYNINPDKEALIPIS